MITLEEYKMYLINGYVYEIDNTDKKRQERKNYLEEKYKDIYINKIIEDTYKTIELIQKEQDKNYYSIKLGEQEEKYITLNLVGGWHSDTIYEDTNGNYISEYILKNFFGNMLIVETKVNEYEFYTEDPDILSFDYEYYLYIQGFLNKTTKSKKYEKTNNIKHN